MPFYASTVLEWTLFSGEKMLDRSEMPLCADIGNVKFDRRKIPCIRIECEF